MWLRVVGGLGVDSTEAGPFSYLSFQTRLLLFVIVCEPREFGAYIVMIGRGKVDGVYDV